MAYSLPPTGHPAREAMGDIAHVVEVLDPVNIHRLPSFREALASAKRTMAGQPAVKAVNTICLRANDERWLIAVGPRGGWTKLWNFGAGR